MPSSERGLAVLSAAREAAAACPLGPPLAADNHPASLGAEQVTRAPTNTE
ncbi:MAG: hypothetical protein ACR2H5_00865 [Ktedonobacteraceae bacterium]